MANPDPFVSETTFTWTFLVFDVSHILCKLDASTFEVVGKFLVWRSLSNESELGLLVRRGGIPIVLVFWLWVPVRLGTEEPVVLTNLEGSLAR